MTAADRAAAEAICCTVSDRWVVAGATWFAAGRALWLLPNMLSEVRWLGSAGRTCACVLQLLRLQASDALRDAEACCVTAICDKCSCPYCAYQ